MTTIHDELPIAPPEHMLSAERMGLSHPIESLLIAPARYEDYRTVVTDFDTIGAEASSSPIVYKVKVRANQFGEASLRGYARRDGPYPKGGYKDPKKLEVNEPFGFGSFRLEIDVEDERGVSAIQTIFGGISQFRHVRAGDELIFRGNAERFGSRLYFKNATLAPMRKMGIIAPVYLGAQGKQVNSEEVHAMMDWLNASDDRVFMAYQRACELIRQDCGGLSDADILAICTPEDSLIRPESLPDLLFHLHSPTESVAEGEAALSIARKICSLSLQCRAQRQNARAQSHEAPIGEGQDLVKHARQIIEEVQFRRGHKLTKNQVEVAEQICARMQSTQPLNGLLSGEVGSGKTVSYAIPAVVAHLNGARVAIIAPTELLADQIAATISRDFGHDVQVERVRTQRKIKNPDAILVSTIGLNSAARKSGYIPNFLILDEQHKLSTASRESMVHPHTHTLDVSATPIPRSLALSLYDGMDLFTLNEQPVKKDIQTALIDTKERNVATAALRKALTDGKRVALVYTLVDKQEGTPMASIDEPEKHRSTQSEKEEEEVARKGAIETKDLFEKNFPGRVALLHGKMSSEEKVEALNSFRSGEKPLMITTTIFETGIDVPDVAVLIVRDPQHLGLSQLHQLRGRLARSGGDGVCFLLVEDLEKLSDDTYDRLNVFCQTNDGYALAQNDMVARGAGELDGLQQKGRATTTFKGVKMTTRDLLFNEMAELDMQIQADQVDADSSSSQREARQASLFG